jgi:hypothetical protein
MNTPNIPPEVLKGLIEAANISTSILLGSTKSSEEKK